MSAEQRPSKALIRSTAGTSQKSPYLWNLWEGQGGHSLGERRSSFSVLLQNIHILTRETEGGGWNFSVRRWDVPGLISHARRCWGWHAVEESQSVCEDAINDPLTLTLWNVLIFFLFFFLLPGWSCRSVTCNLHPSMAMCTAAQSSGCILE